MKKNCNDQIWKLYVGPTDLMQYAGRELTLLCLELSPVYSESSIFVSGLQTFVLIGIASRENDISLVSMISKGNHSQPFVLFQATAIA